VIVVDKDGRISWVNEAFCNLTGYTKEEVTGELPSLLFGPKTNLDIIAELKAKVRKGEFFSDELINYTKDGTEYWVQLNVSPLFDSTGEYEGSVSVENIINDRKRNELKIQAQNQALREIAWISSHEFRRPVASIVSISAMLTDVTNEEEREEYVNLLLSSSKELDHVSRDIACRINDIENSCKSL
jgi:PAS domain S-box-containing protein